MPLLFKTTASGGSVTNLPASSAETVIYTTPLMAIGPGAVAVDVKAVANLTPGTANTAIVLRVRQGGLTGTVVGVAATHTVAAGAPQSIAIAATDASGYLGQVNGGQYVITGSATAATGAGTTNFVDVGVST